MENNKASFLTNPSGKFEAYAAQFVLADYESLIQNLLQVKSSLRSIYFELVPSQTSADLFWSRYFFRVDQLSSKSTPLQAARLEPSFLQPGEFSEAVSVSKIVQFSVSLQNSSDISSASVASIDDGSKVEVCSTGGKSEVFLSTTEEKTTAEEWEKIDAPSTNQKQVDDWSAWE